MLPKFKKKSNTSVEAIKSASKSQNKSKSEKYTSKKVEKISENVNLEESTSSDSKTSSDIQPIKKGKKPNLEEDNKVLLRYVSVLKKDFQNLKERIEKLESQLPVTSIPKKTLPSTFTTSSVQADGSKEKQHDDYRQHDAGQRRKDSETTISHDYRKHDVGYRQNDGIPYYYRQHGVGHRWNDAESGIRYDDNPTDDSWLNDDYDRDQYSYERDRHDIEYRSDHSLCDNSSGSYGRDQGIRYRTHYVYRSSSGYYRMATLPAMAPIRS